MFVWGGRAPAVEGSFTGLRQYYLTYKDYLDILTNCPDVKAAVPVISRQDLRSVSDFFQSSGQLLGVPPLFNQIRYIPIRDGRWLNDLDDAQRRHVIILGDEARRILFPGRPSVGSTITINGIRFEVIGTLLPIGHGDNNTLNLRMFIPFNTMRQDFPPTMDVKNAISFINYQPKSRALHETAKLEVHKVLGRNHGFDASNPDAFDEWDTIRTADNVGKIFDAMNVFLGSVGLVTLALGAIGIINIMLVAVADRTREIGLRKAIGATNGSIMFQFFVEGAFLTLLSGGIGMAFAAGLMSALSTLPSPPGFDPPKLVPSTAALAIGARHCRCGRGTLSGAPGRDAATRGGPAQGIACTATYSNKPSARCAMTSARRCSRCWAWHGASPRSCCCSLTERALDGRSTTYSRALERRP